MIISDTAKSMIAEAIANGTTTSDLSEKFKALVTDESRFQFSMVDHVCISNGYSDINMALSRLFNFTEAGTLVSELLNEEENLFHVHITEFKGVMYYSFRHAGLGAKARSTRESGCGYITDFAGVLDLSWYSEDMVFVPTWDSEHALFKPRCEF